MRDAPVTRNVYDHTQTLWEWDAEGGCLKLYLRDNSDRSDQILELFNWYMVTSYTDFRAMLPKLIEYGGSDEGSADLRIMGDALAELIDIPKSSQVAQELGTWFYVLGKVSRLVSDYKKKRKGKSDTWHDISVYSMMARRIQEVGRWP